MLSRVELVMAGFGTIAAVLAVVNAVQAVLGRPLIGASRSRRSPGRLRRESLLAAIAMAGVSLVAMTIWLHWPAPVALGGFVVAAVGMASIFLGRARNS